MPNKRFLWRDQIVNGRVFQLRSASKRYPPPCALVIDDKAQGWNSRIFAPVDRLGVIPGSYNYRRGNPNIHVESLRREQINSSRVQHRRRDLEKFDADDLALIRYGLSVDFSGRISSAYGDMHIPIVVPADWTVFWLPAFEESDYRWLHYDPRRELPRLLHGAWHFESHGGCRRLGYKFGCALGTRHSGLRLNQIRQFLQSRLGIYR